MLKTFSVLLIRDYGIRSLFITVCLFCLSCNSIQPKADESASQEDKNIEKKEYSKVEIPHAAPIIKKDPSENPDDFINDKSDNKTVAAPDISPAFPGPIHHFTISVVPDICVAGKSWSSPENNITVTACDESGNVKTDYSGKVYFISSDKAAKLPFKAGSEYVYNKEDKGFHVFSGSDFTLSTLGVQTITVIDGAISKTSPDIKVFSNGSRWLKANGNAKFTQRENHSCVTFDNKIWVIGGVSGEQKNDVWYSSDGFNWTCATEHADFSPRSSHLTLTFNGKIWVIGGFDENYFMGTNDVWYSNNGINWTAATKEANFSKRFFHDGVVYDGRMWLIGGKYQKDIWWSINGADWTQASSNPPFGSRYGHSCVVFDSRMWLIGGYGSGYNNDVWWSTNGMDWHQAAASTGFSPRYYHKSLVYNHKVWVIGGLDGSPRNDVWYSENGTDWTAATENAAFETRDGHACTVFNDRMWLTDGSFLGDVWYSD